MRHVAVASMLMVLVLGMAALGARPRVQIEADVRALVAERAVKLAFVNR